MTSDTNDLRRDESGVASGRFLVRIDPALHASLRAAARRAGVSLNAYCASKLAAAGPVSVGPAADVIARAETLFGDELVGVLVFGSWSRGERGPGSDVDVLIILEQRAAITREAYRLWDAEPMEWDGHPVEPHLVHLRDPGARVSGLWAEAAMEGIVLFDPEYRVSKRLVALRQRVLAGEVVRRRTHGHPYWVEPLEMRSPELARDHIHRAEIRLRALDFLHDAGSWADVVRKSQEVVELALKALLRASGIDPPRVHDVSDVLLTERARFPPPLEADIDALAEISRQLRRDRELAFYGAEDLTPSGFYSRSDADQARDGARRTVELVKPHVLADGG